MKLDDDELGGLERREADHDVDDAQIDVVLGRGLLVALDEVSLARRRTLERTLPEEVVHERADVQTNLRPQSLVIRLEDHPLRAAIETFLDEQRRATDGNVFPFRCEAIIAHARARSPRHAACRRHGSKAIDAQLIQLAVLQIGQSHAQTRHSDQRGLEPGGCLPDTTLPVCTCKQPCHGSARGKDFFLLIAQWVGLSQPGKKQRGIFADAAHLRIDSRLGQILAGPAARRVDQQHRTPRLAIRRGGREQRCFDIQTGCRRLIRRNAQQIEQVDLLERVQPLLVRLCANVSKVRAARQRLTVRRLAGARHGARGRRIVVTPYIHAVTCVVLSRACCGQSAEHSHQLGFVEQNVIELAQMAGEDGDVAKDFDLSGRAVTNR